MVNREAKPIETYLILMQNPCWVNGLVPKDRHTKEVRDCPTHRQERGHFMDKPLSRLKSIAVKKELRSYAALYKYVHRYCGRTLIIAVEEYKPQMEEFFDARQVAQQKVKVYKKPHHRTPPRLSAKK